MANTYEQDVLIQNKDEHGNIYISFPITKWDNIVSGIPALAVIKEPGEDDPIQFETTNIVVSQ